MEGINKLKNISKELGSMANSALGIATHLEELANTLPEDSKQKADLELHLKQIRANIAKLPNEIDNAIKNR